MEDLIDLMLGLCDEIKPAGDAVKSFH
jgi:hypothetical protein